MSWRARAPETGGAEMQEPIARSHRPVSGRQSADDLYAGEVLQEDLPPSQALENGDSRGSLYSAFSPERDADGASPDAEIQLEISNVTRQFGDVRAVDGIDLRVRRGEIFALLGPSGCGKTTLLRMVAGLETIDGGSITMRGRTLADAQSGKIVPPERRNIAMVFQSYAIWPHMTVAENVGFPLQMRRIRRAQRQQRVAEVLELTGLAAMADRPATRLSGGQQQRVALARALVYKPDLLLLDEPLSNLDAALRVQMRREIRRLNQEFGTTMLFVTHDQDEALSIADQIAVLNRGRVEQVGDPIELYENPTTPFVRDFIGHVVMLRGKVYRGGSETQICLADSGIALDGTDVAAITGVPDGAEVGIYFRPEDIAVSPAGDAVGSSNHIAARVISTSYLGDHTEYVVDVNGSTVVVQGSRSFRPAVGDALSLELDPARASVWPL